MKFLLSTLGLFILLASFTLIKKDSYKVDIENSSIKWTGYHLAKSFEENGELKIKSGHLDVEDGKIVGGTFIIDMASITSTLEDEGNNAKLVGHLKSDDFFAVEKYPEAKLTIKSVQDKKATGEITIRGISNEISFNIDTEEITDDKLVITTVLNIDRTIHKVLYGWTIENAMISNEFKMEVKIVATK